MPQRRTGRSTFFYRGEIIQSYFHDAVVTGTRFSADVPVPQYATVINVRVNLMDNGVYHGSYWYVGGPYNTFRGTIDLRRENDDSDGSLTFQGTYVEETTATGYTPDQNIWKFEIERPDVDAPL